MRGFRPRDRPPRKLVSRSCCRSAYVRGALLASGSVSAPPSAHLEVRSETREGAEAARRGRGRRGRELRVVERADHVVAYAKGIDRIAGRPRGRRRQRGSASRSRSARWWGPYARARTGWRTPTTRTSFARGMRRTSSYKAVRRLERSGRLESLTPSAEGDRATANEAPIAFPA